MSNPHTFYRNQIETHTIALKKVKNQLVLSGIIRLLVFIAISTSIYYGYSHTKILISSMLIGIIIFTFLVTRHGNLTYTKNKLQQLIKINELELNVIDGNYSDLDSGAEFINPSHPYSHDIDLFGERSFFQYINRTTTAAGKNKLASILSRNSIIEIEKKQEAINTLSKLPKWRQEFSAISALVSITVSISVIKDWLQNYTSFVPKIMRILPIIFSTISLIVISLLFLEIITFKVFLLWFFIGLAITGTQLKKINLLYNQSNQVKDTFQQYYKLVDQIEKTNFPSTLLREQQQIVVNNKEKASHTLKQFAKILHAFDQRNNMLFGFLANGLLLWDLHQSYKIEKWITAYHDKVIKWFDIIATFDAYNSLANFSFNHPNYIYPKLVSTNILLKAKELGHPILNPEKRIDNDITIDREQFLIITGANRLEKVLFNEQ